MTTTEVLKRLYFDKLEIDALKSNRRRLLQANLLAAEKLFGKTNYYRLTKASSKLLGAAHALARPLGEQALPTHYAILSFCCLGASRRTKFTASEFQKHFPNCTGENGTVKGNLGHNFYYLDSDQEGKRLGQMIVDLGGSPAHVMRKCNALIQAKAKNQAFREFLYNDEFLIAIITAEETKAQAIRRLAKKRSFPIPLRVEVAKGFRNVLHVS